jgi:phage recombination protein Bet
MEAAIAIREPPRAHLAPLATWTPEQRELVKKTCFPDASNDELSMFLHVAAQSGLDPLRKQIHAIRTGGRISFVVDINGLQARAAREPDFRGIEHAVVFEGDDFVWDAMLGAPVKHHSNPFRAKPIGAWARVFRDGMKPFVSLVRMDEYANPRNGLWREKPSVMILKVAKSTALRLAYPEQLGPLYERAELDKARGEGVSAEEPPLESKFSPEAVRLADAVRTEPPPQDAEPVAEPVAEAAAPAPERPAPSPAQLRARAKRLWEAKRADGATGEAFRAWAQEVLGADKPSAQWTEADIEKLEARFAADD